MLHARWLVQAFLLGGLIAFSLWSPSAKPSVYDPCASASLRIVGVPEADVWIDSRTYGCTPVDVELSPGRHDISLRADGFRPHETVVTTVEGGRQTLEVRLVSGAEGASAAVAALAQSIGMTPTEFTPPRVTRGGSDTQPIHLLWPKGKVRASGLTSYAIEVDETFEGSAVIVFRCNDVEVASTAFAPLKLRTVQPLPQAVLERAAPGAVVTWDVRRPHAVEPSASASFEVVACPAAGHRLRRIGGERLLACQPQEVRRLLTIHALLDLGLDSEALVLAIEACSGGTSCTDLHRAMLESLSRTGNEHSALWAAALHAVGQGTSVPTE